MALVDGDVNPMMRAESEVVATSAMLANLPLPRCTSEIVAPSAMFTELMMMEPLPRPEKKKPAVIEEAEEPQPSYIPPAVHSPPKETNTTASNNININSAACKSPAAAFPGPGNQGPAGHATSANASSSSGNNAYPPAASGQQQASGQPHQAHSATTSQTVRAYPAAPPSAAACAMAQAAQAASAYMMQAPSTSPAPMPATQAPWQYLGQQLTYQPASRGYTPSYSVPNVQNAQGIRPVYQPLTTTYTRAADGAPQPGAPKMSPHQQAGSAATSVAGAGTATTPVQMGATTSGGWGSYVGAGLPAPARPSSAQVPAHPFFLPQHQASTAAMLAQTFKLQSLGQQGSQVTVATGAQPHSYVAPMPNQAMPRTIQVQRVPPQQPQLQQQQQQPQMQPQQLQFQPHQYFQAQQLQAQQLQPPSKSQPLPQTAGVLQAAQQQQQQQQSQPQGVPVPLQAQAQAQSQQQQQQPQQPQQQLQQLQQQQGPTSQLAKPQQIVVQQKPQVTYGTAPKYTSANFQATGAGAPHIVQPVRATTLPQVLSAQHNSPGGYTAIAPQVRTTAPQYLPAGVYAQPIYRTVQQQPQQVQQVVQPKQQPQAFII